MQYFKKDMKQILEFQIFQGATFSDTQLAPANSTRMGKWAIAYV